MAIRVTSGTLGAGKGLYWVHKIILELRKTDRPIVTNFALRVPPWIRGTGTAEIGLQAYLLRKYGKDFNVLRRVHVLTDEQCREFFMWRVNKAGDLYRVKPLTGMMGLSGYDPDSLAESVPCTYWIDEAWQYFNARDFAKTPRMLLCYNAQGRKLGDDLWLAMQHHSQIEKNLRVLAAEYHECVNHGKRRLGMFKQPGIISVVVSNDPPESRSRHTAYTKTLRLDYKGLGACYDTCSGSGVQGVGGDIGEKLAGVPWWVVVLLVFLVVAALAEVPNVMGKALSHAAKGLGSTVHASPVVGSPKSGVSLLGLNAGAGVEGRNVQSLRGGVEGRNVQSLQGELESAAVHEREITGWVLWGGDLQLCFDDGEVVSSAQEPGRITYWNKRVAVVDGKTNVVRRIRNTAQSGSGPEAARGVSVPRYREVRAGASGGVMPF